MKPRPGNTTNGRKNNMSRLDWDINTCSTQLNYRSDWDINTCSTQLNYLSDWDIDTIRKNSGRPDWDIDTSHANTPHSTLLKHSHTLAGLHPSAIPAAPKPVFFYFCFLRKKQQKEEEETPCHS